ncbi:hypothetical protein ACLK1T_20850 [Escherichia coli]
MFSGMQRKDGNLNFRPGTVQLENWCASRSTIQYQGKPVN